MIECGRPECEDAPFPWLDRAYCSTRCRERDGGAGPLLAKIAVDIMAFVGVDPQTKGRLMYEAGLRALGEQP